MVAQPAFTRMRTYLQESGMDTVSIDFIIGRMIRSVVDSTQAEVNKLFTEEDFKQLEQVSDDGDRQKEVSRLFEQKSGTTLEVFQSKLAEKLVKEFENA